MSEESIDYLFHPKSIAVAGVSGGSDRWNPGRLLMKSLMDFGFKGEIYAVNPSGGEIDGSQIYKSLADIPGSVDYVISAIPASYTPQLVKECGEKGVNAVQFFTSGFGEIEADEGKRLESEILRIARASGVRILGPNCMGLYCPQTGLTFALDFPDHGGGFPSQAGSLGFVSQSGGNTMYCIREGASRGVYFSKAVSYGNGIDLAETDFLEYLADDPDTRVIALYTEGVRDGMRFMNALKRAANAKPVIVQKAGATDGGIRAAASHTGAIAGSSVIWSSLLKQFGAIQVFSIEEMIDMALLFLRDFLPAGRNVAIVGVGGGASVLAAEECACAGLSVPPLPIEVRQRLRSISAVDAGRFFVNPVDMTTLHFEKMVEAMKAIADFDQIDMLLFQMGFDAWALLDMKSVIEPYISSIIKLRSILDKPLAVVLHSQATYQAKQLYTKVSTSLHKANLPVYPSVSRAAVAINRLIGYHGWYQSHDKKNS